MRNRYHFILMLAAALVACVGDTGLTGDIQVQIDDSAGVRIVEYVGVPEVEPPFAIAAEPMYRHGGTRAITRSGESTPAASSRTAAS